MTHEKKITISMSISMIVLLAGCANGCPRSDGEAPLLRVTSAIEVVAKVDSFKDRGAFIDFSNAFIEYHTVYLSVEAPANIGWKSIGLQYQGLPVIDGRRLELGQRLQLTVVPSKDQCCGPYLNEATNVELLPPR